jgi:hypothetical protein
MCAITCATGLRNSEVCRVHPQLEPDFKAIYEGSHMNGAGVHGHVIDLESVIGLRHALSHDDKNAIPVIPHVELHGIHSACLLGMFST